MDTWVNGVEYRRQINFFHKDTKIITEGRTASYTSYTRISACRIMKLDSCLSPLHGTQLLRDHRPLHKTCALRCQEKGTEYICQHPGTGHGFLSRTPLSQEIRPIAYKKIS